MRPASNLERVAGCSPHSRRKPLDERLHRFHPGGLHLDLDPGQA